MAPLPPDNRRPDAENGTLPNAAWFEDPEERRKAIEAARQREEFHAAAIRQAGDFARRNPHLVDDFSDADPGM